MGVRKYVIGAMLCLRSCGVVIGAAGVWELQNPSFAVGFGVGVLASNVDQCP